MSAKIEIGANLVVRSATVGDAAALAILSGQLGYPSSRDEVERRLAEILVHPEHVVFVAEITGKGSDLRVAGWIHAAVMRTVESDPNVEVVGLVVDESLRSSGIGERLVEQAEQWARGFGLATMTVRSNVVRERAHGFYQRLGYRIVKSQRVFRKQIEV